MQARTKRLGWVAGIVIVAAVIATLTVTGYGLDALMLALLVSLLIGAYLTRRNVRAAVLYSRLAGGRPPPSRTPPSRPQGVKEPEVTKSLPVGDFDEAVRRFGGATGRAPGRPESARAGAAIG